MNARSDRPSGFLVVNAFLNSSKFNEIYSRLGESARSMGISLDVYSNAELFLDEAVGLAAEKYDFCLFWDKDIRLASRLEESGLRLFNPSRGIENCDSKIKTADMLFPKRIPMPETIPLPFTYDNVGYTDTSFLEQVRERLSLPFVIKEERGSFGAQVYLANTMEEAVSILEGIGGRPALAQRFVSECRGRDIRINMVGRKCIAAMERYNEKDFRANISGGGKASPCSPTQAELDLAAGVMELMELDFAGVDILRSKDGPLLCEVNSTPHFRSIEECTGANAADAIMKYISENI